MGNEFDGYCVDIYVGGYMVEFESCVWCGCVCLD